jgi:hypothetical protein
LDWKSIGEMEVIEIDENTGDIVIKRDYGSRKIWPLYNKINV